MAARGLVPLKGGDLVTVLVQLGADADPTIASAAQASLEKVPEGVLLAGCEASLHPSILDALASIFFNRHDVLEVLVQNRATADATIAKIASRCNESLSELIAINQQRLLAAPAIIEALYKNRHTRMSTADRLVELAARHGVELEGIPAFRLHVQALENQLIPEPSEEPLPSDMAFTEALASDSQEDDAIERDLVDGTETLKEKFKPLHQRIREMSISERIRLALIGDAAARSLLLRDSNKLVSHAAVTSPRMTELEAVAVAHSKEVNDDVLRYIGNKRDWLQNYELKRALVFNPKSPLGMALRFLSHLRDNDLRQLARSRGIPAGLKTAAIQRINAKDKKKS